MRRIAIVLGLVLAGVAAAETEAEAEAAAEEKAEEWRAMVGPEITQALTGRVLEYERAWQRFNASGRTLYNDGRDSWGYWAVRGDQYCSQWPPNGDWACYDMARRGERFRFVDAWGQHSIGLRRAEQE